MIKTNIFCEAVGKIYEHCVTCQAMWRCWMDHDSEVGVSFALRSIWTCFNVFDSMLCMVNMCVASHCKEDLSQSSFYVLIQSDCSQIFWGHKVNLISGLLCLHCIQIDTVWIQCKHDEVLEIWLNVYHICSLYQMFRFTYSRYVYIVYTNYFVQLYFFVSFAELLVILFCLR